MPAGEERSATHWPDGAGRRAAAPVPGGRWRASVSFGAGWQAHDYVLCEGPWAWVAFRARLHRLRYPYRAITVAPVPPRDG